MSRNPDLDRLDTLATMIRDGDTAALRQFDSLSTSERRYVALAADRHDLLGDSIVGALDRIGEQWAAELVQRHRFA